LLRALGRTGPGPQHVRFPAAMGCVRPGAPRLGAGRSGQSAGPDADCPRLRRHLVIAWALVLLQGSVTPLPPDAEARPFPAQQIVDDAVLAEQRGGIRLPNGIDVNLSIDT